MWGSVWGAGEGNRSIGSSGIMGSDQPRAAESWYLLAGAEPNLGLLEFGRDERNL